MDDNQTYQIIGACMEVHREMGCGFLEAVYQEALEYEFTDQNILFSSQPDVTINYKKRKLIKKYIPDFFCFNEIIVEIKALDLLTGKEEAQIINYLKASKKKLGILINFGHKNKLESKRFVL